MIGAGALRGLTSNALVVSDAALPSMKATALFREGSGLNACGFSLIHSVDDTMTLPRSCRPGGVRSKVSVAAFHSIAWIVPDRQPGQSAKLQTAAAKLQSGVPLAV
jgi:hypothetical protein